jgi:hypothetical protein
MAYVVKDRVKVTSTTTGTGTFTLGAAVDGYQDFSVIVPDSAWDLSTASYSQRFSVASQENSPVGLFFKPDGLKMYVTGYSSDGVYEYNLSTAWDITTASYLQTFSVAAQETQPHGLFFKPDGLKMYVVGITGDDVNEYDLGSAWNISTASFLQTKSVSAQDTNPTDVFFKPDGLKMYIVGTTGRDINEYDLSSAWNVSTASYLQVKSVSAQTTQPAGVFFKPDGLKMYVVGQSDASVYEYTLTSAWNISTASYTQTKSVLAQDSAPNSVFFKPDGAQMYIAGGGDDYILGYVLGSSSTYYCIANGTDWEIGVGTVANVGTTLARTTILESSNSDAAVNWGAGDKDVYVTFPADATQGTVPTGDDSSVGTNLVAWTNLQKTMNAGIINGVPYANGVINGIVSTYSLIKTSSAGAYSGGVLSANGDVYFVPDFIDAGQKVSIAGVVSTYSLVNVSFAGMGGVLASNGDIHFIPSSSTRGQKISASGVVSTYSLVYTTSVAYEGGVLAANGDIHFVPSSAAVGQKVSAAGVVSTYSLVLTGNGAYAGGVLAPNGDIYFIPKGASRGQKVSAAGVVSTYSLVYTVASGYTGGILAANGDIHFIPRSATRGQKINTLTGVVSTYSLVYTLSQGYCGGVLAPNGDIHFVPQSATRGQKISASGVVSTYALAYTLTQAYQGGVLAPNGDIYFVPWKAAVGQKISTGVPVNIGYALSPFFNKL